MLFIGITFVQVCAGFAIGLLCPVFSHPNQKFIGGWNELLNGEGEPIFQDHLNTIQAKSSQDNVVLQEFESLINQDDVLSNAYSAYRKLFKDPNGSSPSHTRKDVFKSQLLKIVAHNLAANSGEHSWWMGVNQYTDVTEIELTRKESYEAFNATNFPRSQGQIPNSFNWVDQKRVSAVRDSKNDAYDALFAVASATEGVNGIQQNWPEAISASVQQLVDCAPDWCKKTRVCRANDEVESSLYYIGYRCLSPWNGYSYNDPPAPGTCREDNGMFCLNAEAPFTKYGIRGDVDLMSLLSRGPIIVYLHASTSIRSYRTGVYKGSECGSNPGNLPVVLVGWGTDTRGDNYWLIKNSWGQKWGIQGFLKLARNGASVCNLYNNAMVVRTR